MMLTVFASVDGVAWSSVALFGLGLLIGFSIAIALSSQRWLLRYWFGGIVYWLSVEGIHNLLLSELALSEWDSYVAAMGISWLPLLSWIVYRALRYETITQAVQQQRELADARYIEHTPVYDDDFQPRFR